MYSGLCVGLGIADDVEESVVRLLLSLSSATVPLPPTSQACFLLTPKLASDGGSTVEQVPSSEVTAVDAEDSVEVVESAGEGTGDASAESDMADADEATELAGEKAATS